MIRIEDTKDPVLLSSLNKFVQDWHAQKYPEVFKPYDKKAIKGVFEKWIKDDNILNFVAYFNADPAGYLIVHKKVHEENAFKYATSHFYLDQIAVLPEYRNNGIAQLLIKHAINIAKEEGVNELLLDHWSENRVAKALFAKLGFRNFREHMFLKLN